MKKHLNILIISALAFNGLLINSCASNIKNEESSQSMDNKSPDEKFLINNKSKEGVITTDSGLQYKILRMGSGEKPEATDTVVVHYKGTLIDGTEFDSSYKRGQTISFPLNRVIKGWTEGLQLMPVGSRFKFFIPSELAYGDKAPGDVIKPNSTLIFEVELIDIK